MWQISNVATAEYDISDGNNRSLNTPHFLNPIQVTLSRLGAHTVIACHVSPAGVGRAGTTVGSEFAATCAGVAWATRSPTTPHLADDGVNHFVSMQC